MAGGVSRFHAASLTAVFESSVEEELFAKHTLSETLIFVVDESRHVGYAGLPVLGQDAAVCDRAAPLAEPAR